MGCLFCAVTYERCAEESGRPDHYPLFKPVSVHPFSKGDLNRPDLFPEMSEPNCKKLLCSTLPQPDVSIILQCNLKLS